MTSERGPRWLDWGGEGPGLHLAHVNGFPPATYRRLAGVLTSRYHVLAMEARALRAGAKRLGLTSRHPLCAVLALEFLAGVAGPPQEGGSRGPGT